MRAWLTAVWLTLSPSLAAGQKVVQQAADMRGDFSVSRPMFPAGDGPVIAVDAGHNNFHTAEGRYAPFASVLKNDGFKVISLKESATPSALSKVRVLVIANALAASNVGDWKLPTPSAFTQQEVVSLHDWVNGGGSLLVIADHMPFAGAAQQLAAAFGFRFDNDYAAKGDGTQPEIFSSASGTLLPSQITKGSREDTEITEVETFVGSSFQAPAEAKPIMVLDDSWTLFWPSEAGKFNAMTPQRKASKMDLRGAALEFGKGRVVVLSEAAFLTNQLVNGAPYGFGRPSASQDKQFLLNVVEWLSGS